MKKMFSTSLLLALSIFPLACGGGNAVPDGKSDAAELVQSSTAKLQALFPEHAASMLAESRSSKFDGEAELLLSKANTPGGGATARQKASCNGDVGGVVCCCFWDGPVWGCFCQ